MSDLRSLMAIGEEKLQAVNRFLTDPDNPLVNGLLAVVDKFGGPEAINRKAAEARRPETLMARLKEIKSPYVADLEWLAG